MATRPARYVYAVDRTEEFAARIKMIMKAAQLSHTAPVVRTLSSKAGDSVVRDFGPLIEDHDDIAHVILIVTHEALKIVDHAVVELGGWELIVDEDPKLWMSDTIDVGASVPFWEATYQLDHFASGYSHIRLKADAPTWREMSHDVLTRPIAAFHDRARKRKIVVNIDAGEGWSALQKRQRLTYFSVWDVEELLAYRRVTFLANCFDKLLSFRLITALYPSIKMVPISIGQAPTWKPRNLTINYAAEDHRAGSTFFSQTEVGRAAVIIWADWVRARTNAADHYWATNKAIHDLKLPGYSVSPKIAGSNEYRERTQCSVLYSAKASKAESKVFADLTGGVITGLDVHRDRELEDLIQIVFRSSLRMPDDQRSVMVNVYDREQAEFLRDYFVQAGFPFQISVVHHDIGLTYTRAKPGPKPKPANPNRKTAAERARDYRARKAATLTPPIN